MRLMLAMILFTIGCCAATASSEFFSNTAEKRAVPARDLLRFFLMAFHNQEAGNTGWHGIPYRPVRRLGSEFLGKRSAGLAGEVDLPEQFDSIESDDEGSQPEKRALGSELLGKRVMGSEFLGKRRMGSEFLGKRTLLNPDFYPKRGRLGSEFLGKRSIEYELLGKRAMGSEFLGKRLGSEFLGKRLGSEFLGKRAMGSEFLGKRAMGSEFLGKRLGSEFLGKRLGSEFLGKRAMGSEFLGKRLGSEFLGKRAMGSEFLGKRVLGSEFLGKRGAVVNQVSPQTPLMYEDGVDYNYNSTLSLERRRRSDV